MGGRNPEEGEAEVLQSGSEQQAESNAVWLHVRDQACLGRWRQKTQSHGLFSCAPRGPALSQGGFHCQKRSWQIGRVGAEGNS